MTPDPADQHAASTPEDMPLCSCHLCFRYGHAILRQAGGLSCW